MAQTRAQKVNYAYLANIRANGNLKKAYYKHGVKYGDYFDLRIYCNIKTTYNGIDTSQTRREEGTKRSDSLARSKNKVYRLVAGNVRKHGNFRPIFATYTFAESVVDLDEALERYRQYLRRLQNYLGYKVKYVAVPQIQWERFEKYNEKVWHFHIVFFNVPKLDLKKNDKFWGQGDVNLQFVRGIRDVGAYVAGYFTKKDFDEIPLNRRFYYCSRDLIQPQDFFHNDTIDSILNHATVKVLSVFEGDNFTQTKYKLL